MHYISLGFSCQTRFSLDDFDCHMSRLPFDFNITKKSFLLNSFKSDGNCLVDGDFSIYQMPVEKWQGVRRDGILYWHDFQMNGFEVMPGWQDYLPALKQKYAYLWQRLRALLRSDGYKKIYISNTQSNLSDYTRDDSEFNEWFGLDADFYYEIRDILDAYGTKNYDITFVNRSIEASYQLSKIEDGGEAGLTSRFGSALSLPFNHQFAASLIPYIHRARLRDIAGKYTNGCVIEYLSEKHAAVYIDGVLWGEIVPFFNGYLMTLNAKDLIWKATLIDGNQLKFSNNTSWFLLK